MGGRPLRLAFVVPWRETGHWVWSHLPSAKYDAEVIAVAPHRPGIPYLGEFLELLKRRDEVSRFDVVFAWELRCAVAIALLRRLRGDRHTAWVSVGPILKGPLLLVLPFLRWLLADAARIVCFSSAECGAYARSLRLPRDRFDFIPTPWQADETAGDRDGGFILALGRSARDFPTLLRAVRGTDLKVVVVTDRPQTLGGEPIPDNVSIRYNTEPAETEELIATATVHCVPLRAVPYSAGQTVLLRAMAKGKSVVITDTLGTRDYVVNNRTAILVPPGDEAALRVALCRLWSDATERRRIGRNASHWVREEFGFRRFAERLAAIAEEVTAGTEREQSC